MTVSRGSVASPTRSSTRSSVSRAGLGGVARGGALNLAGSVVAAGAGLGVTWLAARALPAAEAGALFAGTAAFVLVLTVAKLGTQTGLVYWLARLRTLGSYELIGRCLRAGLLPVVGASLLAATGLWFAVPQLRVLAVFLPFAALADTLLAATRGFRAIRPTVVVDRLLRPGLQVVGFLILALAHAPLAMFVIAWAAPYVPAFVVAGFALRRQLPGAAERTDERIAGAFWRFTGPRAFAGVAQTALQKVDVLLVAGLAGFHAAALYAVAGRFVLVGQLANLAISQSVQPRLAELLTTGDRAAARTLYQSATAWLVLMAWPMYLLTVVFAPLYLGLFGSHYRGGTAVVTVLASATLVGTACGMVDTVLSMAGRTTWNLGNVSLALVVMVGLDVLLIPWLGALGAAIGLAAAILTNNLVPLTQIASLLRIHPFGPGTLIAVCLASVCFGLLPVLVAAVLGENIPALFLAVLLGSAAYAVGCWRFRRPLRLAAIRFPEKRGRAGAR